MKNTSLKGEIFSSRGKKDRESISLIKEAEAGGEESLDTTHYW